MYSLVALLEEEFLATEEKAFGSISSEDILIFSFLDLLLGRLVRLSTKFNGLLGPAGLKQLLKLAFF